MRCVVGAFACVILAACGSSSTGGAGACALDVQWGSGGEDAFVQFRDGDRAPMTTDAQNTCFVDSTLRFGGTSATQVTLQATITADGYQPDEQPAAQLSLAVGADGSRYVDGLHVAFRGIPPQALAGKQATVMLEAKADGCGGWTATTVQLAGAADAGP